MPKYVQYWQIVDSPAEPATEHLFLSTIVHGLNYHARRCAKVAFVDDDLTTFQDKSSAITS